jgi:hypothetical protein
MRATRVDAGTPERRHLGAVLGDGLQLLAVIFAIPFVILAVGLPVALLGRLLVELVNRF